MSMVNEQGQNNRRNGPRNTAPKSRESDERRRKPAGKAKNGIQFSNSGSGAPSGPQNRARSGPSSGSTYGSNSGTRANGNRSQNHGQKSKPLKSSKPAQGKPARQPAPQRPGPGPELGDAVMADVLIPENEAEAIKPTTHLAKQNADPLQNYSAADIAACGPLFPDPAAVGFMKPQKPQAFQKRPVPRYMRHQPRSLFPAAFRQDPWDAQNQAKMREMEAKNGGSDFQGVYEDFQKMREIERAKMEQLGLVDAENITKDLNDAIVFQGTCLDMCPTFERVRRSLENNVKALEKDPETGKISPSRAIKAFSRPAAGQPPPMPSDVRPPKTLASTLDYLVDHILPQLPDAHSFVWDRTRSIRQDFVYQNYYGPEAIDCNEKIVRIHLLSLHIMAGSGVEYSQQQEMEQLNKALQTLSEMYADVRNHGGTCPNEAEFRAYHLISHYRDPELEREIQQTPDHIFRSREVQTALRFRTLMSQNNVAERGYRNKVGAINLFVEFFRLALDKSTPLLLACLLETHFNEIRFYALKSLSRAYHTKGKAFSAEALRQMLGFDTLSRLEAFVAYYEIDTLVDRDSGALLVDLCNKEKLEKQYKLNSVQDKPRPSPAHTPALDARMRSQKLQSLVNSGHANGNLGLKKAAKAENVRVPAGVLNATPNGAFGANPPSQAPSNVFPAQSPAFGTTPPSQNPHQASTFGQHSSSFGQNQSSFGQAPAAPSFGLGAAPNHAASHAISGSLKLSDVMGTQAPVSGASGGFGKVPPAPAFDFTAKKEAPVVPAAKPEGLSSHTVKPAQSEQKPSLFSARQDAKPELPKPVGLFGSQPPKAETPEQKPPSFTGLLGKSATNAGLFGAPKNTLSSSIAGILDTKEKEKEKEKENEVVKKDPSGNKNVPLMLNKLHVQFSPEQPKSTFSGTAKFTAKLLKQSPSFSKACESIYQDLVADCIKADVGKITSQMVKFQSRRNERNRLIGAFADELFNAFLAEQMHQALLESVAKVHYEKNLKRKAMERISPICKSSYVKQQQKKQREAEMEIATFKAPSLKRRDMSSSCESSFIKRRTPNPNFSYENISQRQDQISQLWQPVDLRKFVQACSENVKLPPHDNENVSVNCILIAEDWKRPYSKWLNTKLSLKVSADKTHYTNEVSGEELAVTFRSLPKRNFLDEKTFRNTPFLVFECGLLDESQVTSFRTFRNKLTRDHDILAKIVQICDRFCYYKVQILLVLWDVSNSGMPSSEQRQSLGIDSIVNADNCVQTISVCDMSTESTNILSNMESSLFEMGHNFTGKLSKRGVAKRVQLAASSKLAVLENTDAKPTEDHDVTASLKAKEVEILKKAKDMHKRRYLSAHANRSTDFTNVTNGSFANHTLMNYNNSFAGNHTFLANNTFTNARDLSLLRNLGNANTSVIEESTPVGSPRPAQRVRSVSGLSRRPSLLQPATSRGEGDEKNVALPRKVQELRDIAASIKARYKKQ